MSVQTLRKDTALWYSGIAEVRVLIDPSWIHNYDVLQYTNQLDTLARYAQQVTVPTQIQIVYPKFLEPRYPKKCFGTFVHGAMVLEYSLRDYSSDATEVLNHLKKSRSEYEALKAGVLDNGAADEPFGDVSNEGDIRLLDGQYLFEGPGAELIGTYQDLKCDYLITENPWIIENQDLFASNFQVYIGDPQTVLHSLQLMLRNYGVFIEVLGRVAATEGLGVGTFYPMEDVALATYTLWFDKLRTYADDPKVFAFGRAAFYHRFPFLRYAFDLAGHHIEQSTHFENGSSAWSDHRFHASYHINAFYIQVAGLFDNIAWLWNYALGLGFVEVDPKSRRKCILSNNEFSSKVRKRFPKLGALLVDLDFNKWLARLTDLQRHPAVHRQPLFLTDIIEEGTERVIHEGVSITETAEDMYITDLVSAIRTDMVRLNRFLSAMVELPLDTVDFGREGERVEGTVQE